jgi:hypothetical protein
MVRAELWLHPEQRTYEKHQENTNQRVLKPHQTATPRG